MESGFETCGSDAKVRSWGEVKTMSRRKLRSPMKVLADEVLVAVAKRLGPHMDRLDVEAHGGDVSVRELVMSGIKDGARTPTEVRVAILDLVEQGHVTIPWGDVLGPDSRLRLTLRGLLAARVIEPGCGRPVATVSLRMKDPRRGGLFAAALDTGNKQQDRMLNHSGLALAAFYILGALRPTEEHPLFLTECRPYFIRLAGLQVGPKSGPGMRLAPALDSIAKAIDHICPVVKARRTAATEDGRATAWVLSSAFPDVRIVGARGPQYRDWSWLQCNLGLAIRGQPFIDREQRRVDPMSDADVARLERDDADWEIVAGNSG